MRKLRLLRCLGLSFRRELEVDGDGTRRGQKTPTTHGGSRFGGGHRTYRQTETRVHLKGSATKDVSIYDGTRPKSPTSKRTCRT